MAKATVFHPSTGQRKVVTVGDPNAFAGGFVLETKADNYQIRQQKNTSAPPPATPPPATPPAPPPPAPTPPILSKDPNQISGTDYENYLGSLITSRTGKPATQQDLQKLQEADRRGIRSSTGIDHAAAIIALDTAFPIAPPPPPPAPKAPPAQKLTPTPVSDPSIVNFLTSIGLPSDFTSRSKLAKERGITGYIGSATQNTRLLQTLRKNYDEGTFGQPQKPGEKPKAYPGAEITPVSPSQQEQGLAQDRQAEIDKLNAEWNKKMQDEESAIKSEAGGKVDLSTSTGLVTKLLELLETKEIETPASLEQKFIEQRKTLGIGDLEEQLAQKNAEIKKVESDFSSTIEEEEGRRVSITQIRRRQGAQEIAYNRIKRDLIVERDSITNQLNMKYGVLSSMVKFSGLDYDNAQQDYQFKWNASMQMTNLVKGIEESAKTDKERKDDNARANVQIMFNLLKGGNVDYDGLDESTKLDIKNMEIQSGFPVGFTKFISETIDDPVIHFGSEFTDEGGNRIQPVTTVDKDTGNLTVKNVNLGKTKAKGGGEYKPPTSYQEWELAGGEKGTGKTYAEFIATKSGETEAEKLQSARSDIATFFNMKKGKDGYVSPDDFKKARNAWGDKTGLSDDEFLKSFKRFANPDHYEDYDNSYF